MSDVSFQNGLFQFLNIPMSYHFYYMKPLVRFPAGNTLTTHLKHDTYRYPDHTPGLKGSQELQTQLTLARRRKFWRLGTSCSSSRNSNQQRQKAVVIKLTLVPLPRYLSFAPQLTKQRFETVCCLKPVSVACGTSVKVGCYDREGMLFNFRP